MTDGAWYNRKVIADLAARILILLEENPNGVAWHDIYDGKERRANFKRKMGAAIRHLKYALKEEGRTVRWLPSKGVYVVVSDPIDGKEGERHAHVHLISTIDTLKAQAEAMCVATQNDPTKEQENRIARHILKNMTRVLEDVKEML